MTTILIGGDVCPIGHNEHLFRKGCGKEILNDLMHEFENSDFSVLNLECPLIKQANPIDKSGSCFGVPIDCVQGLVSMGVNAVNLANNHILDHGAQGLQRTITTCKNAQIDYFGAGANRRDASKILIQEINGQRIGFLGIAENEFSITTSNKWGANPVNIIETVRLLKRTQNKYDFLVVLVHGGKEHYRYPTPRLQEFCKFLVEEGAGAVVCQHSHCVGCYEHYQNAPIIYGQGNFIFEPLKASKPSVLQGLLIKLILDTNNQCCVEWIPLSQSRTQPGVRRMPNDQIQVFLNDYENRSKEILKDEVVQKKWLEHCTSEKYLHASRIRGHNKLFRLLNKSLHYSDWFYTKHTKLLQRNTVLCEVHREALETLWLETDIDF